MFQRLCGPTQVLCLIRGECVDDTDQSKRSCPVATPYNKYTPQADYKLRSEFTVNISTLGYHIVSIEPDNQPEVFQGDTVGWTSQGDKLAYHDEPNAFAFEFPAVTSEGAVLRRDASFSVYHQSFIIAAHYSQGTQFVTRQSYNSPGLYSVTTNITSPVFIAVDYPIAGVNFLYEKIVKTNTSLQFEVPIHNGTNVTYMWDFGNGLTMRSMSPMVNFTYTTPGSFEVILTAANSLNSVTIKRPILCFDAITGFKFSNPIVAKGQGEITVVKWEVFAGTNVTYVVDFGDGTPRATLGTHGATTRTHAMTHVYTAIGNYTVTVSAFNLVGPNSSISSQAVVEIPLTGLEFSTPLPHVTSYIYLAVGDYFEVARILKNGSNVLCRFDFKDGSGSTVTREERIKHQYSGMKFSV